MTKSYRESFSDFRKAHPDINISETTFRRLKPFYVRPATARDLEQCCCMKCVTVKKGFRALMNYRKRHPEHEMPVFENMYGMVHSTLCPKAENQELFEIQCIKQECEKCGLDLLKLHEAEEDSSSSETITWFKFDYVNRMYKGRVTRHLELVKMQTAPNELVDHLCKHLKGFPLHLFTAKWQRIQWNNLIQNLPPTHVAIEMDFFRELHHHNSRGSPVTTLG